MWAVKLIYMSEPVSVILVPVAHIVSLQFPVMTNHGPSIRILVPTIDGQSKFVETCVCFKLKLVLIQFLEMFQCTNRLLPARPRSLGKC